MEVVKTNPTFAETEERIIPTKEEVVRVMTMELNSYNRLSYFKEIEKEIQALIESNQKSKLPLLDGINVILKKFEDRVALITFETNAYRMQGEASKVDRI